MKTSAQKTRNSTQKFIEIQDIVDDLVILSGGYACIVIEIKATNFALLSVDEQNAKIYAYASLLNSLSYPLQIVIRSKRLNISSYLKLLEEEANSAKNPVFGNQISMYKDFVAELVKVNTILDKKFYAIIYYSSLESGIGGVSQQMGVSSEQSMFVVGAKSALHSKAEGFLNQIQRVNLQAEVLKKEKLVKLFYEIYNDVNIDFEQAENLVKPQSQEVIK
jgi:hypothetical protein